MQPQSHHHRKSSEGKKERPDYQSHTKSNAVIPETWDLSVQQRQFIESLIEKK